MALHKELETYNTNEFTITASAPMAGPYDLSGTMTEDVMLGTNSYGSPSYLPYVILGLDEVYGVLGSYDEIFSSTLRHNDPSVVFRGDQYLRPN